MIIKKDNVCFFLEIYPDDVEVFRCSLDKLEKTKKQVFVESINISKLLKRGKDPIDAFVLLNFTQDKSSIVVDIVERSIELFINENDLENLLIKVDELFSKVELFCAGLFKVKFQDELFPLLLIKVSKSLDKKSTEYLEKVQEETSRILGE